MELRVGRGVGVAVDKTVGTNVGDGLLSRGRGIRDFCSWHGR